MNPSFRGMKKIQPKNYLLYFFFVLISNIILLRSCLENRETEVEKLLNPPNLNFSCVMRIQKTVLKVGKISNIQHFHFSSSNCSYFFYFYIYHGYPSDKNNYTYFSSLVTPGLGAAGHILLLSNRFIKDDFPTFGYPTIPARTCQKRILTNNIMKTFCSVQQSRFKRCTDDKIFL